MPTTRCEAVEHRCISSAFIQMEGLGIEFQSEMLDAAFLDANTRGTSKTLTRPETFQIEKYHGRCSRQSPL